MILKELSACDDWYSAQAIILAAGRGSRLNGLPDFVHKSQVLFDGRTLLEHQLDVLARAGIHDVCVVTGFNGPAVRENAGPDVHFVHNGIWTDTNSLYSLSLCQGWVDRPLVVMNCDVLLHPDILTQVIDGARQYGNSFAYDATSGSHHEHMKVTLDDGQLIAMRKQLGQDITSGENVGVLAFNRATARCLFEEAERILSLQGAGVWMSSAVERIAQYVPLYGVDVAGLPWIEIDYPEDYASALKSVWPAIRQGAGEPTGVR